MKNYLIPTALLLVTALSSCTKTIDEDLSGNERSLLDLRVEGQMGTAIIDRDGSRIVDRSLYRSVQTPQVFRAEILRNAYARPFDERFTDDASVVEAAGHPVYLCEGSYENIKITTPVDMLTAEALLAQRQRTSATAGE